MEDNRESQEETFEYTYSARQQEEIESIKRKYLPPQEDKMEQLRRLDASVTTRATIRAIAVGVIGTLIFGAGMSCSLAGPEEMLIPGIVIGLAGFAIMGAVYPWYKRMVKKQREELAPQILALAEELSKS